ncbi:hypothetical protein CK203_087935 [Vitis vinifera]|uniref:Uncharacterized protein n=1 Tax=Vitis vinifera TaxID=29760 RepID=A0A438D7X6_VITVI|nr:hypothetical protein CK203_087935 [Vitis vinifera]
MKWSPQDAMKAYLHTLQLCKTHFNDQDCTLGTRNLIQPQCMEFISALAAGNQAKLMVQITSDQGITPLTIALAVAAKHTKARFICILHQLQDIEDCKAQLSCYNLKDVVELVHGDPCEVIMGFKNIDFAVIDCKLEDYLRLFKIIDVNPRGSVVVASNLERRRNGASFGEVVKGRKGVEYVTRSIGEGMELTRIRLCCKPQKKKYKRFHVTFES